MNTTLRIAMVGVLSLGLGACSTTDELDDAGTYDPGPFPTQDAAPVEADTAPALTLYTHLAIQDTESKACTTNGPGADIDAVALVDATGAVLGTGLAGSATFTPAPAPSCTDAECSGGKCKYAYPYVSPSLVEGPEDGVVGDAKTPDEGYFSLNGGTVQVEIGDDLGTPLYLKKGDLIRVSEVDHLYFNTTNNCVCKPETFQVVAQNDAESVTLVPMMLDPANLASTAKDATLCPAIALGDTSGCGTTVFVIP